MSAQAATIIAVVSALVAMASFFVNGRAAWRKENREQEEHQDREADRTIELLKEQNALLAQQNATLQKTLDELKRQADQREAEWRKREAEWLREKKALETRVGEMERDYRALVLTVTTMGFCANAAACDKYNPGDRRAHTTPDMMPGGTD